MNANSSVALPAAALSRHAERVEHQLVRNLVLVDVAQVGRVSKRA